jgi:hypothetical protein
MNSTSCWPLFPLYINEPWALLVVVPVQVAYFYLDVRLMLQVLRTEVLTPGWKLFWLAVIAGVPLFGPLSWLASKHSTWRRQRG